MRRHALILALVLPFAGCNGVFVAMGGEVREAPQAITADDETYVACEGAVYINAEGEGSPTFRVKFIDREGQSHTIHGIKKLHVTTHLASTSLCGQPNSAQH